MYAPALPEQVPQSCAQLHLFSVVSHLKLPQTPGSGSCLQKPVAESQVSRVPAFLSSHFLAASVGEGQLGIVFGLT